MQLTLKLVQLVTFSANFANGTQTGRICSRCQPFHVQVRSGLSSSLRFSFASSTVAIRGQVAAISSFAPKSTDALALLS